MPSPSLHDTLQQIQERLSRGQVPQQVIEELLPQTSAGAVTWARRLTGWEEFGGQFPPQVVALARLISRRAMRAYTLTLSEDGRVIDRTREGRVWQRPPPALTFRLAVQGQELRVEYTPDYFPNGGRDLFSFVSPHEPPQSHGLSETGYLSHMAPHDAVEACGGARVYAALFAEARLRGQEQAFSATFEGAKAERKQRRGKKTFQPVSAPETVVEPSPVLGEHTARVMGEQLETQVPEKPPRQSTLFDELS